MPGRASRPSSSRRLAARRRHVDEPRRRRHRTSVHDELGHDDVRRRALRPARGHDRQRGQRRYLGDIANVRVDNTAPTGAITAPLSGANVRGTAVTVTSDSADAGSGVAQRALPALARGRRHVDERGGGRHHGAVRGELGHDRRARRPLRPAGRHHRQGGQHVHLGARHERPRRQHRARRLDGRRERRRRRLPERPEDLLQGRMPPAASRS